MITDQDLVILKAERLTDYDDGGGNVTGQEVVDGEANNLFGDISELDRVYGRVSLRKAFPAILTDNTDMAYGAHAAITDPPADGNVSVTMFSRGSWADERTAAADRIESFVISGPESIYTLYGDHLTGQRMLRCLCAVGAESPEVGSVYRLSIEKTGYTAHEQYIRVLKINSRATQEFSEIVNNTVVTFKLDVLLVEISATLAFDFPGGFPSKTNANTSPTKVRTTQVADAARYFGVARLAQSAEIGDLGVTIDSPYVPLVPSTQSETPVVDVIAGMGKTSFVPSGAAGSLTYAAQLSGTASPDYPAVRYLGQGVARGSVTAVVGAVTLTDQGNGTLSPPSGDTSGYSGTVDYLTGMVTINRTTSWTANVSLSATPAAPVTDLAQTLSIPVSLSNRGYNYVPNLSPPPAPGTLTVDYRALGKWVRLTDNGKGQLTGRTGEGTGTVDYATGSVIATLGALPDVDSAIIFSWSIPSSFTVRAGDVAIQPGALDVTVSAPAIKKTSLTVTWLQGAVEKTATDDGLGALSGDATGTVDYLTGRVIVRPTTAPDPNSLVVIDYTHNPIVSDTSDAASHTGAYEFTIGASVLPLKQGMVSIDVDLMMGYPVFAPRKVTWADDGAGNLTGEGLQSGTIDYDTGAVSVTLATSLSMPAWTVTGYTSQGAFGRWGTGISIANYGWANGTVPIQKTDPAAGTPYDRTLSFRWTCMNASAADSAESDEFTHDGVTFDLTPQVIDQVVPGSVRFAWAGQTYVDRAGVVYRAVSNTTNAGTAAGTIDYATGTVKLTNYVAGANALTVASLLTSFGDWSLTDITFRTPGCPLKPASFSVRAMPLDGGANLSAVADTNGNITSDGVEGFIEVNTGIAQIRFGRWVATGDLTAEDLASDWYDPDNIVNGEIFKPVRVIPSSVLFNGVVYSYVPLEASILGIDPVRLPQDGRVPIFRSGDAVLVHHTLQTEVANPVAGATESLRMRIAFAQVHDADGVAVPSDRYTVALDAGTLTWANPLDLAGYTLPLTITHRIEDLLLCSDVQITGELAFVTSLTHDFPADESFASSVLIIGDMQARVEKFHDLTTFTTWSDDPTGSAAPANFNTVLYPPLVTNRGAVEERWRVTFTGATTFNVIGEVYGQIVTGANINNDLAPTNPQTGVPYFFLDRRGWGGGWATGNTVRFNTRAANYPVWFVRTTLQGPVEEPNDHFRIQVRADAN